MESAKQPGTPYVDFAPAAWQQLGAMPTATYRQIHTVLTWLGTEGSDEDETEFTVRVQDWELRGVCDTHRRVVTVLEVQRIA